MLFRSEKYRPGSVAVLADTSAVATNFIVAEVTAHVTLRLLHRLGAPFDPLFLDRLVVFLQLLAHSTPFGLSTNLEPAHSAGGDAVNEPRQTKNRGSRPSGSAVFIQPAIPNFRMAVLIRSNRSDSMMRPIFSNDIPSTVSVVAHANPTIPL